MIDHLCAILEGIRPARSNPALVSRGIASYSELKCFVADRPGHDLRYSVDARMIERELGWTARHGFDAGLRRTVSWYVDNPNWCADVAHERHRLGLAKEAVL
jgi:dTDP-glucose 4,6-dehydratase